jgi:sulfite exporter TauE/SafE
MNFDFLSLTTAFLLGLMSSAHCIGMCGGIMGALSMAIPANRRSSRWWILLCYNLGRIASYALIGLLLGSLAQQLAESGGYQVLRWIAGLLLIAMGLYLANWWRGLVHLEKLGGHLWAYIQPLGKRLMPVDSALKAFPLGFIWGWLPCGLVYSALAFAASSGNSIQSASLMLAFGLGTLPTVWLSGVLAQELNRWLQIKQLRWAMATLIILFGLWTLWGGNGSHDHHQHSEHHPHSMPGAQTEIQPPVSDGAQSSASAGADEHHHHHSHH